MAAWSDLHPDIQVSILRRLPTASIIVSSAVCSSWRLAAIATLRPSIPRAPSLMLASSSSPTAATFLTLSDATLRSIPLPDPPINDRIWLGSSSGWLVTADQASEIILLNPLTRAQRRLPSITTLPHLSAVIEPDGRLSAYRHGVKFHHPGAIRFRLFDKAVVGEVSPNSEAELTVILVLVTSPTLAFARVGDEAWTPIKASLTAIHDVIMCNGRFCSLDSTGKVVAWDLTGASPQMVAVLPEPPLRGVFADKYLVVEKSGQFLQVWRMAASFQLFRMDSGRREWVVTESVGDQALFLGNNCSMALSSQDFVELQGNSIYFTQISGFFQSKGCGNWVYSLDDGGIKPCYPESMESDWPLPIWIVPCLS